MVQSDVKQFGIHYKHYYGNKLFEYSLLKKFTKRVTFVVNLILGSHILSRSMEADILQK